MSLSANKVLRKKTQPFITRLKVVSGLIEIFQGAHLAYKAGDIGYVQLASDSGLHPKYCGIALEHLSVTAALNSADGTYDVAVLIKGANETIEMDIASTITIANEGDPVYMKSDDQVDLSTGVTHSVTDGLVGIIRQYISANKAWVQLVPHRTY